MAKTSGGTNNYAKAGARVIAVTSTGRKMTAKQAAKVKDTSESIDSLKHREVVKQLNRVFQDMKRLWVSEKGQFA